jgi:hypothetical protein
MPRATAERFQITSAQAAVDVGKALETASFEQPLTMSDLGRAIARVDEEGWNELKASQRTWYRQRARHIISCLHFVGSSPVAEDKRDGRLVYFLIDPP